MNEITKGAVEDLVKAVLGFIPGASLCSGVATASALAAASRLTRSEKELVTAVTESVFVFLTDHAASLSPQDPGRSISAAYDIIETVRAAGLDADKIVECDLDPHRVCTLLLQYEPKEHEYASAGRPQIYREYLREFCIRLVDAASRRPVVHGKVSRRVLQQLSKLSGSNKALDATR